MDPPPGHWGKATKYVRPALRLLHGKHEDTEQPEDYDEEYSFSGEHSWESTRALGRQKKRPPSQGLSNPNIPARPAQSEQTFSAQIVSQSPTGPPQCTSYCAQCVHKWTIHSGQPWCAIHYSYPRCVNVGETGHTCQPCQRAPSRPNADYATSGYHSMQQSPSSYQDSQQQNWQQQPLMTQQAQQDPSAMQPYTQQSPYNQQYAPAQWNQDPSIEQQLSSGPPRALTNPTEPYPEHRDLPQQHYQTYGGYASQSLQEWQSQSYPSGSFNSSQTW